MLLILMNVVNICHGYFLGNIVSNDDLLMRSLEATGDVIRASDLLSCSLAVVSDGSLNPSTFYQLSENLSHRGVYASVEIPENIHRIKDEGGRNLQNLGILKQIKKASRCTVVILPSDDEEFLTSVIQYAYELYLLVWPTAVIVITSNPIDKLQGLAKVFSSINGLVIVTEGKSSSQRSDMYVYLPYSFRLLKKASWTPGKGLSIPPPENIFPDKFNRFEDFPNMVVAGDEYPPHMAVHTISNAEPDQQSFTFSGPMVYILEILAKSMNFTYSLRRSVDGSWGYRRQNGSWTGMVGMLRRNEIDFALGPFGVTSSRAEVMDYSLPLLFDYARITARQGDTEIDMWGILMPLTPSVWASILGMFLVIVSVTMGIYFLWSSEGKESTPSLTFDYIRILLQQDVPKAPSSQWHRTLMGVWLLAILVLFRSYSGNLMSLLAVRYIPQPFQSLRDAIDDPEMTMIWEGNNAYVQHFFSVKSGIFKEVADASHKGQIKYISTKTFYSSLHTLVMQRDHIFIAEDLALKMLIAQHFSEVGVCHFYLSKEMFLPLSFAMAVQKNSPLRQPIDKRIRTITESGLYNHWLQSAIPNSTSCDQVPTKTTVQATLSLRNIMGLFMFLGGGIILGVIALFFEMIWWKFPATVNT